MEFEAHQWFSRERDGQVLIVVTGGDFRNWDEIRKGALPPSLRDKLQAEPLFIRLSEDRCEQMRESPNDPIMRKELTEDLKQVLLRFYPDRDWNQLCGDERSQRRRALTLLLSF